MRRKFPVFWVLQLLLLTGLGFVSLCAPRRVVELSRGERAPRIMSKPSDALHSWALELELVQPPNEVVRTFFREHRDIPSGGRRIWTPNDPSVETSKQNDDPRGRGAETTNTTWSNLTDWLLSCEPPPPAEQAASIRDWIRGMDEVPEPSHELRDWIVAQKGPQTPPKGLRLFILGAKQTLPVAWRLAAEQVRLSAACVLAAALFTLFGLLNPSIRRPLARTFVLMILFLTVSMLRSSLGPPQWNLTFGMLIGGLTLGIAMIGTVVHAVPKVSTGRVLWCVLAVWWASITVQVLRSPHETGNTVGQVSMAVATCVLAIMGVVNAHYWLIGHREDLPQDNAGIAQRRPPQLWTLWLVQFAIVLWIGIGTLVFPRWTAELFAAVDLNSLTTDVVTDSVRMLGAWLIALALFSYFALGVAQDWIWQGIGWMFCTVLAVLALGTTINALSGDYSIWAYVYVIPGLVFVPVMALLLLQRDPWSTENVERAQPHLSLVDVVVAVPLLWTPLFRGRRALYRHGTGTRGRLRVLPYKAREGPQSDGIPDSDFFVPGSELLVEARFANRTQADDAALDIRSCALRLSREAGDSLDLLFATGAFAPASCLLDFRQLLPRSNLRRGVPRHKVLREGLAAGMRRAPASFASLSYYNQLVLEWLTAGADHYLVRFRLVPLTNDGDAGQGLPDGEDLRHLWKQERRTDEPRGSEYLRQELHDRLAEGQTVSFRLEAQFHFPCSGDSLDWYDPSLEWDERTNSWQPLAELVLDQPLNAEESLGMRFNSANLPLSMRVPMPDNETDFYDPRSLAAAQFRVVGSLARLRTLRRRARASLHAAVEPATTLNIAAESPS